MGGAGEGVVGSEEKPFPYLTTGLKFDINEDITEGMGFYSYDSKGVEIEGADVPWLYTNGCFGLRKCEIPLIDDSFGEEAGRYTVRLGFASSSTRRIFDIKIQDRIVIEDLDILKETGEVNQAVVKEVKGIHVVNNLSLELIPEMTDPKVTQVPVINFIEVIREDTLGKAESIEEIRNIIAGEAQMMLVKAGREYDEKDFENALINYHTVLKGSRDKNLQLKAFEGMEKIASKKSLPVIKKYCQKLDPIMWNYEEPDQELVVAANRVYDAISGNYVK